MLLAVLVPLLAGGGWFLFPREEAAPPAPPVDGEVVSVEELTVNIVGEPGRYAQLGFAVVLASDADPEHVTSRAPLLRDAALDVLTGFTGAELQTEDGMERLRAELTARFQELFPGGEIRRAVLTDLIVQ